MRIRPSVPVIVLANFLLLSCDIQLQDTTKVIVRRPLQLPVEHGWLSDLAWSPDGRKLAFTREFRPTAIMAVSPETENTRQIGLVDDTVSRSDFALSPDATKIVYYSYVRSSLWVADLLTGKEFQLVPPGKTAQTPAWSPDGDWIAFRADSEITDDPAVWIIPSAGGSAIEITGLTGGTGEPSWSPDGKQIVYTNYGPERASCWIVQVESRETRELTVDLYHNYSPDWSPDGAAIAYTSRRPDTVAVYIIPASGGEPVKLTRGIGYAADADWAPDGSKLAYRTHAGTWVSSRDGEIVWRRGIFESDPTWTPDSELLFFKSGTPYSNINVFDFTDSTTAPLTQPNSENYDRSPSWFPDSDRIAFSRARAGTPAASIWTASHAGGAPEPLRIPGALAYTQRDPAVSPDGRRLAFNEKSGKLFLFALSDSALLDLSGDIGYGWRHPSWAPDSRSLICAGFPGLGIFKIDATGAVFDHAISGSFSSPTWSASYPDMGETIAAVSPEGISTMRPDGSNRAQVVQWGESPDWAPNSARLAYVQNNKIYVMTAFKTLE